MHVLLSKLVHILQPIYKEVMNKEHEIIMLLNKAKDALNKTTQRSDTRNLQRDVEKIQQLWDKLRKETVSCVSYFLCFIISKFFDMP